MTIAIQFLGAARHVTGSRYLLSVNERRILLECGMVQGPRRIADAANRDLRIDPNRIDAVVLSHAHIDHSGSLPRLVKLGYRGPIHCTEGTESLLGVLLADSAHIQAGDARHLRKRGVEFEPAYDADDVARTLRQVRGVPYHRKVEVTREVHVEFFDAGHILGSAMVVLSIDDGRERIVLSFTGDHGRKDLPILRDPEKLPPSDFFITESTYGNRLHEAATDLEEALGKIIMEELRDGGRVLIPAFSVGRTQNVVLYLGNLIQKGRIPRIPIWVDSPLSTQATRIMARHADLFDAETRAILESGRHPFFFDGVRYVADAEESKTLNDVRTGVILAASGMCEAGRILHHLKHSLGRKEDCVLMVGYQATGTLGRKLLDGYEGVKVYGERYAVRCKVRSMPGLSAHADYQELLASTGHLAKSARGTFVLHGEEDASSIYADRLTQAGFRNVEVPVRGERYVLVK
jgi:metallo-beta-lactamase family protein